MGKRVLCAEKDAQQRITSLGGKNSDGTRWNHSKPEAESMIERNSAAFYVREEIPPIYVYVTKDGHLKTTADAKSRNNLDNLPNC